MKAVAGWFRERFALSLFGPVCLLLTAAAAWSARDVTSPLLSVTLLFGVVLLVQFRLWDDLEDRDRDRQTHPARVLVNAPTAPFHFLLVALTAASFTIVAYDPEAGAATLVLNVAVWCAYRIVRPRMSPNGWRFGLLPWKYSGFVAVMTLVLGDADLSRLAMAATATYVCASGYELLHDTPAAVGGAS
jgi:hypothetical protein